MRKYDRDLYTSLAFASRLVVVFGMQAGLFSTASSVSTVDVQYKLEPNPKRMTIVLCTKPHLSHEHLIPEQHLGRSTIQCCRSYSALALHQPRIFARSTAPDNPW